MVSSPIKYSKLVMIHDGPDNPDFGTWLHQRLLYAGIPAWQQTVDIVPLAGYGSSIDAAAACASVVLFVVFSTHTPVNRIAEWDCKPFAGKKRLLLLVDNVEIPEHFPSIDFYTSKEAGLARLLTTVHEYGDIYPPIQPTDGKTHLESAKQTSNLHSKIYDYLNAMQDMSSDTVRSCAVKELGALRVHSGMISAALKDPSPAVRSQAALALANFRTELFKPVLQITALEDTSVIARFAAQVALSSFTGRDSLMELVKNCQQSENEELRKTLSLLEPSINSLLIDLEAKATSIGQHIFVSYARSDAETFSFDLAKQLRREGFSVWIDENLSPGTPVWQHEIMKAIEQACLCLFIVSPGVKNSEWVPREWKFATDCRKEIIPVIYQETLPMPLYLNSIQGLRPNLPFSLHSEQMFPILVETLKKKLWGNKGLLEY